jgi:hypothetical protein
MCVTRTQIHFFFNSIHVKETVSHHGEASHEIGDGKDGLRIRTLAVNALNKQVRIARGGGDKPILWDSKEVNNRSPQKPNMLPNDTHDSGLAWYCEHGNEPSGFIKGRKTPNLLSDY